MPVMLERWNDDKMDALDAKVDGLDREMRELRHEMKAGFERIEDRFERFEGRFERMQHLMVQVTVAISGSMIVGFGAMAAAIATKL